MTETEGFLTRTHKRMAREGHVTGEAAARVTQLQVQLYLEPPEAGRGWEQLVSWSLGRELGPVGNLDVELLASGTGENKVLPFSATRFVVVGSPRKWSCCLILNYEISFVGTSGSTSTGVVGRTD